MMWLFEIIVSVILEGMLLHIFKYPGALVIWVLSGFTLSFRELLQGSIYITGFAGVLAVAFMVRMLLDGS